MIPIAGTTRYGIQFYMWTQRFVDRLKYKGRTDEWAFMRPNGDQAKAAEYRNDNFTKFERIQAMTNLIDLECKVMKNYRIQRS